MLIDSIDTGQMKAVFLINQQHQLSNQKEYLQSWSFGSLTSLEVRAELAEQFSAYAEAAEVQSEIQSGAALFDALSNEIETLLASKRANGQFVDADPVTGQESYMILASPDTDALRAQAVLVRDFIAE